MKVLCTVPGFQEKCPDAVAALNAAGHQLCMLHSLARCTPEEVKSVLRDASALIVGLDEITADVIRAAPNLRVIARFGAGVDNIDVKAAADAGVVVAYTPSANAEAVADFTFGLLLALARGIVTGHNCLRKGRWERRVGSGVHGKCLGIVGFGQIGKAVALRAKGFDMKVVAYDKFPDVDFARRHGVRLASLEGVLRQGDFVTVHVPLTPETRGFIGKAQLRLMKRTAFLVNTARGEVVDEAALKQALEEGWITGAAVDVFSVEPPVGLPLLCLPEEKLLATPHIAAYEREALREMGRITAENVIRGLAGDEPLFRVKMPGGGEGSAS